jgi:hypothetical protein
MIHIALFSLQGILILIAIPLLFATPLSKGERPNQASRKIGMVLIGISVALGLIFSKWGIQIPN